MYGTPYTHAIPAMWALIATGGAVVYTVCYIAIFFTFLFLVAWIILAVFRPIFLFMNGYD